MVVPVAGEPVAGVWLGAEAVTTVWSLEALCSIGQAIAVPAKARVAITLRAARRPDTAGLLEAAAIIRARQRPVDRLACRPLGEPTLSARQR